MTEARVIVQAFGPRIRQLHVSEVNTNSEHVKVSLALKLAMHKILDLIDDSTPLIIESVVTSDLLERELSVVRQLFQGCVQTLLETD